MASIVAPGLSAAASGTALLVGTTISDTVGRSRPACPQRSEVSLRGSRALLALLVRSLSIFSATAVGATGTPRQGLATTTRGRVSGSRAGRGTARLRRRRRATGRSSHCRRRNTAV